MKKILVAIFLFCSFSVSALSLREARSNGWVEELETGYIKATDSNAESLVEEINTKRKKAYEKISKNTGTSLNVVGTQAARKIKDKLID